MAKSLPVDDRAAAASSLAWVRRQGSPEAILNKAIHGWSQGSDPFAEGDDDLCHEGGERDGDGAPLATLVPFSEAANAASCAAATGDEISSVGLGIATARVKRLRLQLAAKHAQLDPPQPAANAAAARCAAPPELPADAAAAAPAATAPAAAVVGCGAVSPDDPPEPQFKLYGEIGMMPPRSTLGRAGDAPPRLSMDVPPRPTTQPRFPDGLDPAAPHDAVSLQLGFNAFSLYGALDDNDGGVSGSSGDDGGDGGSGDDGSHSDDDLLPQFSNPEDDPPTPSLWLECCAGCGMLSASDSPAGAGPVEYDGFDGASGGGDGVEICGGAYLCGVPPHGLWGSHATGQAEASLWWDRQGGER